MLRHRFTYLISQNSGVTYIFFHYFEKIKFDSYDSLPIEKTLTLQNVIIHNKSDLNKYENHYSYKIFFKKWSYELAKK